MGQFSPSQSRHPNRKYRGGLPERPQAHVASRGHLWRDPPEARPRQDEVPQDRQRQQGVGLHCQQGRETRVHRRRRCGRKSLHKTT